MSNLKSKVYKFKHEYKSVRRRTEEENKNGVCFTVADGV